MCTLCELLSPAAAQLARADECMLLATADPACCVWHRNHLTSQERMEAGKQWTDQTYAVLYCRPDGEHIATLSQLITDGKLKVHVADVIPLEKAR